MRLHQAFYLKLQHSKKKDLHTLLCNNQANDQPAATISPDKRNYGQLQSYLRTCPVCHWHHMLDVLQSGHVLGDLQLRYTTIIVSLNIAGLGSLLCSAAIELAFRYCQAVHDNRLPKYVMPCMFKYEPYCMSLPRPRLILPPLDSLFVYVL